MRQLLAFSCIASLLLFQQPLKAQGVKNTTRRLQNTAWKSFIGQPVNDTIVIRFVTDSMYLQTRSGETMVSSVFTVTSDTILLNDVSGAIACLNEPGKYKYAIVADVIKFDLIQDAGRGRVGAITTTKWERVK